MECMKVGKVMVQWEKLNNIIDSQARALVGILCRRIEVLQDQKVLTPSLYKSLVKELIYENSRQIKALIKVHLEVGKVIFKSKEK